MITVHGIRVRVGVGQILVLCVTFSKTATCNLPWRSTCNTRSDGNVRPSWACQRFIWSQDRDSSFVVQQLAESLIRVGCSCLYPHHNVLTHMFHFHPAKHFAILTKIYLRIIQISDMPLNVCPEVANLISTSKLWKCSFTPALSDNSAMLHNLSAFHFASFQLTSISSIN